MTQRPSDTRRPTIIDVADLAGVSRQTVSRVLSDHPRVAPTTRARVKGAIENLGYRPNRMARALVTKTSLTFGVASVDMRNLHFAETCSGLQAAARDGGYHLVVTELDPGDQGGIGTLETLLTLGVDGIILFPSMVSSTDLESFVNSNGCCLVMIGRGARIPGVVSVALDEPGAARSILDHLIGRGKRRVGLLMNELFPRFIHTRYEALYRAIETKTGQSTIVTAVADVKTEFGDRLKAVEIETGKSTIIMSGLTDKLASIERASLAAAPAPVPAPASAVAAPAPEVQGGHQGRGR